MQKNAIAVYQPSEPLEKAIQDAYHTYAPDWLTAYQCILCAKAIHYLKSFTHWLDQEHLYKSRLKYFFNPALEIRGDEVVLVTHPIYVRDIVENQEINACLFNPIALVSKPLAYFLFPEYKVQIFLNVHKLKHNNTEMIQVGGLCISETNLNIADCVVQVKTNDHRIQSIVENALGTELKKVAVSLISRGVFKIDEHERDLMPDMSVLRKDTKEESKIELIEPTETGEIIITHPDGNQESTDKITFDKNFVRVAFRIGDDIRWALKQSHVIDNLIHSSFDIDLDHIDYLKIIPKEFTDKYAETNQEGMFVNKKLFDGHKFNMDYFYVICHEFVHWVCRIYEHWKEHKEYNNQCMDNFLYEVHLQELVEQNKEQPYLADKEEVLGFVIAMAVLLEMGKDNQYIRDKIFPRISWHFHEKEKAEWFYNEILQKSVEWLKYSYEKR